MVSQLESVFSAPAMVAEWVYEQLQIQVAVVDPRFQSCLGLHTIYGISHLTVLWSYGITQASREIGYESLWASLNKQLGLIGVIHWLINDLLYKHC